MLHAHLAYAHILLAATAQDYIPHVSGFDWLHVNMLLNSLVNAPVIFARRCHGIRVYEELTGSCGGKG